MSDDSRTPLLEQAYHAYLVEQDSAAFIRQVCRRYTIGTLERLAAHGRRESRRAAVLALGFVAPYSSNPVLGRALNDPDRGVRIAAENGIRSLWCRDGNEEHRHRLGMVIRLNAAKQYADAIEHATELVEDSPAFAEAWNQRAIAFFASRKFDRAIKDCCQVLEINPYHFGAAAGMAQCYAQLRDFEAALDCFRRALRLNPNLEGVRANIAHLERALNRD